jgi:hypothetical protein
VDANLGDGGGLEAGRLRDVANVSVATGDNGKGGSGGESRFVLRNMSAPIWGFSKLSRRICVSSDSSSNATRPDAVFLCPLESVRRDWESGRLTVYGNESGPRSAFITIGAGGGELVGSGGLGGN